MSGSSWKTCETIFCCNSSRRGSEGIRSPHAHLLLRDVLVQNFFEELSQVVPPSLPTYVRHGARKELE